VTSGLGHDGGLDSLRRKWDPELQRTPPRRRRVAEQDGVDLRGRYFLTATIDQFLDPTGKPEVTVTIENPQVARSKPSVGKGRFVRFGL